VEEEVSGQVVEEVSGQVVKEGKVAGFVKSGRGIVDYVR
jgi:hypothetical protein